MNTSIQCHIHQLLTKCVLSLSNRNEIPYIIFHCRFTNTCLFALSTNTVHWSMTPSCLWVRIKAPTGLGYTMTGSISKGSNSMFNDDVHGKIDHCTHSLIILSNETPIMVMAPLRTHSSLAVFKGIIINIMILVFWLIIWLILTTDKHLLWQAHSTPSNLPISDGIGSCFWTFWYNYLIHYMYWLLAVW